MGRSTCFPRWLRSRPMKSHAPGGRRELGVREAPVNTRTLCGCSCSYGCGHGVDVAVGTGDADDTAGARDRDRDGGRGGQEQRPTRACRAQVWTRTQAHAHVSEPRGRERRRHLGPSRGEGLSATTLNGGLNQGLRGTVRGTNAAATCQNRVGRCPGTRPWGAADRGRRCHRRSCGGERGSTRWARRDLVTHRSHRKSR